jgi:hypothetical protein
MCKIFKSKRDCKKQHFFRRFWNKIIDWSFDASDKKGVITINNVQRNINKYLVVNVN